MLEDYKRLKTIVEALKDVTKDNDSLRNIDEQHCFFNTLIDFGEPFDEYNSIHFLPAFPNNASCIPIPSDSSFWCGKEEGNIRSR